ncbi:MAG: uL15 family ribosomal protein [Candidatus Pacearchaeota archaeon]
MSLNKKRKKSSRMSGSHTHGRGGKKKARGSGHRGGFGMAGTGKRADHKKTLILNQDEKYFGKEGLKAKPRKLEIINVGDIEIKFKEKEVKLEKYKILGEGEIHSAKTIYAGAASESAILKIEKAGGKVIIRVREEGKEPEKKKQKKE